MSAPLYQLTAQYRELQEFSDEDIDGEVLRATLEALTGKIEAKAQAVAMVVGNIDASADAIDQQAKLMSKRAARLRERAEGIRTYLKINMQATGITRIDCEFFKIALRKNPPRVTVLNQDMVPDRFIRYPEPPPAEVDKRAVLDAHKAGEAVPGVAIEQDERVEIRS